jgi:quinohemoprotein amine dehydrogenase
MRKRLVVLAFASIAFAQAPAPSASETPAAAKAPSEPGIPVTDALVIRKCSGCHNKDDKGNLSRISWDRATPEGWQQAIKRMVRLHQVSLTPGEAKAIVQSLSETHGLAPEEAKPYVYYPEKRHLDREKYPEAVREACVSCHPYGQAANWRRSAEEWDLLVNMHIGYFPVVNWNSFVGRSGFGGSPPPPGTDTRKPVEKAIEQMKKDFPLHTKEWADWRASRRSLRLAGRWLLKAYQPGAGQFVGEVTVEPGASEAEWNTRTRMTNLRTGEVITREGKSIVYTGYAWRGSSRSANAKDAKAVREVMMVSRDQNSMEGRWFWGGYDEFGYDVELVRAEDRPVLLSLSQKSLRAGTTARIKAYGDQLPTGLKAADLDLGLGITVKAVLASTPNHVEFEVAAGESAVFGHRDLAIRRTVLPKALAVYDTVDYIKASTDTAIARLGGTTHPKGYAQFVAHGFHRGLDGKPNTEDDIALGPVEAEWSLEEFYAVYGDDDVKYVGTMAKNGFFTPNVEGPNPEREFSRNNYGDVWAVATYRGSDAAVQKDGKPLTAKCYFIVTVPQYMRWDQPEVAQQ